MMDYPVTSLRIALEWAGKAPGDVGQGLFEQGMLDLFAKFQEFRVLPKMFKKEI